MACEKSSDSKVTPGGEVDLSTLSRARLLEMIPHAMLPRSQLMELVRQSVDSPGRAEGMRLSEEGQDGVRTTGLESPDIFERSLTNQAMLRELERKVGKPSASKVRDPTSAIDAVCIPNPGLQVRQVPDKRSIPQGENVVQGPTPPKKPLAEGSASNAGGAPTEDGVGWRPITTLSFERIKRLTSRLYSNKKEVDELVAETMKMMDALRGETAAWKNFSQMIDNLIWTLRAFAALKNHPPEMFVPVSVVAPPPGFAVDTVQVSFS